MDPKFINSSTWMRDTFHLFGHRTLLDLVLPGTHDSAAYRFTDKYMPGAQQKSLQAVINLTDFIIKKLINNMEITQELTIYKQLKRGARYLDIRAGWLEETWYTYHAHAGPTVQEVLEEVKRFLDKHECEIVIIEISHFRNKTKENEKILKRLIFEILGPYLCDRDPKTAMIFDIISSGKRAVVAMPKIFDESVGLWSDKWIKNSYPDASNLKDVISYNEKRILDNPSDKLLKISWILTPSGSELTKVLLDIAKDVNHAMTKSFYKKNRNKAREKILKEESLKLGKKKEKINKEEEKKNKDLDLGEKNKESGIEENKESGIEENKELSIEENKEPGIEENKEPGIGEEEKNLSDHYEENKEPLDSEEELNETSEKTENSERVLIVQRTISELGGKLSLSDNDSENEEEEPSPIPKSGLEGIVLLIDNFGHSNIMDLIYSLNNLIK